MVSDPSWSWKGPDHGAGVDPETVTVAAPDTMRAGINTCRILGDFLTCMCSLNSNLLTNNVIHLCVFVSVTT